MQAKPVASELWGQGGTLYPPSSGLVPPVPYPQVKDAAYVKILSKRLQLQDCIRFVQINFVPPQLRKRSDAPGPSYVGSVHRHRIDKYRGSVISRRHGPINRYL